MYDHFVVVCVTKPFAKKLTFNVTKPLTELESKLEKGVEVEHQVQGEKESDQDQLEVKIAH